MKFHYLVPIIALALTGCAATPTTQIHAFGASAKAVTERVDAVFVDYNDALLTRSLTDYAATYSGVHANELSSELLGELTPPIDDATKKRFAIYRANRAIGVYAQALSELAVAASSADLDSAAVKLYGALDSFNAQYKETKADGSELFEAKDLEYANQLITAIGVLALEKKRNNAIRGIVILADAKIAVLCDVIDEQLGSAGIYDGISTARRNSLVEELKDYKAQAKKDVTLDWRLAKMERLYQLNQDVTASKKLIESAQKSIREVKAAHAVLASELKDNRFNSKAIAGSVARLRMLKDQYDDFDESQRKKSEKDKTDTDSCTD